MQYLIPVLAIAILVVAAYGDVRTRRIPNGLAIAVAALGVARLIAAGDAVAALTTFGVAAAIFAVGFLLFWRGLIGGGDVKLIGASVLLVGHHSLSLFLFAMGLGGLVVTLAVLTADRLTRRPASAPAAPDTEPQPRRTVPYGVAIATGAILTLLVQSPVSW